VRHAIAGLSYTYGLGGGTYRMQDGHGVVDARIPTGTYDLLFDRNDDTFEGDRWVPRAAADRPLPSSWQIVRACVAIP
jgi:hypothetical protein